MLDISRHGESAFFIKQPVWVLKCGFAHLQSSNVLFWDWLSFDRRLPTSSFALTLTVYVPFNHSFLFSQGFCYFVFLVAGVWSSVMSFSTDSLLQISSSRFSFALHIFVYLCVSSMNLFLISRKSVFANFVYMLAIIAPFSWHWFTCFFPLGFFSVFNNEFYYFLCHVTLGALCSHMFVYMN